MGRHSAPDEPDDDEGGTAAAAVRTTSDYRPRRARPADDDEPRCGEPEYGEPEYGEPEYGEPEYGEPHRRDEDETARIAAIDISELYYDHPGAGPAEDRREQAAESTPTEPADRPHDVSAPAESDLDLIRGNSAVRARVLAAVLVPFVLYVAVLFGLGAMSGRTFLIWIWVPLVSAGVLAGLILDAAHRGAAPAPEIRDEPAADGSMRDEYPEGFPDDYPDDRDARY